MKNITTPLELILSIMTNKQLLGIEERLYEMIDGTIDVGYGNPPPRALREVEYSALRAFYDEWKRRGW